LERIAKFKTLMNSPLDFDEARLNRLSEQIKELKN
jgi:hypothetical protein